MSFRYSLEIFLIVTIVLLLIITKQEISAAILNFLLALYTGVVLSFFLDYIRGLSKKRLLISRIKHNLGISSRRALSWNYQIGVNKRFFYDFSMINNFYDVLAPEIPEIAYLGNVKSSEKFLEVVVSFIKEADAAYVLGEKFDVDILTYLRKNISSALFDDHSDNVVKYMKLKFLNSKVKDTSPEYEHYFDSFLEKLYNDRIKGATNIVNAVVHFETSLQPEFDRLWEAREALLKQTELLQKILEN